LAEQTIIVLSGDETPSLSALIFFLDKTGSYRADCAA